MPDEDDADGPRPVGPSEPSVADDLRRIAAVRSPKGLGDGQFPALFDLLDCGDDPDERVGRLRTAITEALDAMPDPQFRAAATALFAFDERRWTPLRKRGEIASASFSVSFDAFRRARRSTGTSLLDETVAQLAAALVRIHGETTGAVAGDGAAAGALASDDGTDNPVPTTSGSVVKVHEAVEGERRSARWLVPALGLVVIGLIVGIGVYAYAFRGLNPSESATAQDGPSGTDGSEGTAATGSAPEIECAHAIGETDDPALQPYQMAFVTQIEQLTAPGKADPCGAGEITRWGDLVIQKLEVDGKGDGAIIATDPDHIMVMTQAEYTSYRQIGGKNGNQAQKIEGLPRRRGTSPSGKASLIYTDHGVLASEGVDQPGYYLGGPVWTLWKGTGQDTGEMGMVASNPLNNAVGYYQDFANGRLTLTYSGNLTFSKVDDPASFLPEHISGNILRHDDGTTWYIDANRVRHWIPDGGTWNCIHDRGAKELDEVPGYAILTLQLGDPATCATRP